MIGNVGPTVVTHNGVSILHHIIAGIAGVCHEQNRAFCMTLGDFSQEPWVTAPEWQRTSAVSGVTAIATGRVKYPAQSHDNWMAEKLADGWVYGETKDVEAKTHPCIVSFGNLPASQQAKDVLFFGTAVALLRLHDPDVATEIAVGTEAPKAVDPTSDDIVRRFTYHAPKGSQVNRYARLRDSAKTLAYVIVNLCPPSRERERALDGLDVVSMLANAAIARNE